MTATEHREDRRATRLSQVAGPRLVFVAAAVVLVFFATAGVLSLAYAAIGLAVVAAAALLVDVARPRLPSAVPLASRAEAQMPAASVDAMLAALPDPVVALDRDGIVMAFNARASALAPALRRGEPASFALRMPEVVEAIRHTTSSGEPQRVEFSERIPVDRWYQAHVTPLHLQGERTGPRPDLVLMTVHDLTPLRRVEEMRADFVANASHELRTPLAALSGFIETLQGPARDDAPARERFLGIMKQQAFRMARLIDDLLSLSRIELNVHVRPETATDLVAVVRQVTDAMQMLARDRGVDVTVNAPSAPVMALGDRDELVRVFENLVENALKYGAAGKRVEIGIGPGSGRAREAAISVRDFGPGISPEHLPRLTERFYRVDVAQSRAEGGTGLGLAIVKHILARHQARLTIESTLGQGATFTVHLQLADGAVAAERKSM